MANLNAELRLIENLSAQGLIKAAIHVRRDMSITKPYVPFDTGNLDGSWFASPYHGTSGPYITMGFMANYAIIVHESMDMKFKKPGAGPKFFEKALKRNTEKILEIIREEAKIK